MTNHISTRKKLKTLSKRQFSALICEALLTPRERDIVNMVYIQHKQLDFIADELGYAESTVRLKHRQALQKIKNVMDEKDGHF